MKKRNGFYMAELMISLAGWLLITGFFVPYYIHVKKQTIQVEERSEAHRLLYESIQTLLIEGPENINSTVVTGDTIYEIRQEGEGEITIRYEDVFGEIQEYSGKIP